MCIYGTRFDAKNDVAAAAAMAGAQTGRQDDGGGIQPDTTRFSTMDLFFKSRSLLPSFTRSSSSIFNVA